MFKEDILTLWLGMSPRTSVGRATQTALPLLQQGAKKNLSPLADMGHDLRLFFFSEFSSHEKC